MKVIMSILFLAFSLSAIAGKERYFQNKIHYRTIFGSCPSKAVGRLTLTLIKEFEKNKSLLDIKKRIVEDKLEEKYFLSSYSVNYNPLDKMIRFEYNCPKPVMKVQIYKNDGEEFYTAILVDNGKLFDPTYEILLRSEKKIVGELPHLALPVSLLNGDSYKKLTTLLSELKHGFTKKISEVILSEKEELTIILSVRGKASSAFLGKDYWSEKVGKLEEVISYLKKKKTVPAVINLTNSKKIVVKFSEAI